MGGKDRQITRAGVRFASLSDRVIVAVAFLRGIGRSLAVVSFARGIGPHARHCGERTEAASRT